MCGSFSSTFFGKVPGKVRDEGSIVFPGIIGAFVRELGELGGPNEVPGLAGWGLPSGLGTLRLGAEDSESLAALWQFGRSVNNP